MFNITELLLLTKSLFFTQKITYQVNVDEVRYNIFDLTEHDVSLFPVFREGVKLCNSIDRVLYNVLHLKWREKSKKCSNDNNHTNVFSKILSQHPTVLCKLLDSL